jgi:hypothetical protein
MAYLFRTIPRCSTSRLTRLDHPRFRSSHACIRTTSSLSFLSPLSPQSPYPHAISTSMRTPISSSCSNVRTNAMTC